MKWHLSIISGRLQSVSAPGERRVSGTFQAHDRSEGATQHSREVPGRCCADGFGSELVIVPTDVRLDVYPERQVATSSRSAWARCPGSIRIAGSFQYAYLSRARTSMLDPQGRIQIPADYRESAGLAKDVLIIGMHGALRGVEQRALVALSSARSGAPLDDLRERLAEKGV